MGYKKQFWKSRVAERTDLSTYVVHLTRESEFKGRRRTALDGMWSLLEKKCIYGSSTESGFIVGDTKAVCFQDSPLHGICQNVYYEQKYREDKPSAKVRYQAMGLAFPKEYVFRSGGRPVIYDVSREAKRYLPEKEWWRIVNYDLYDDDNFIDWTHEREWRVPRKFEFDISEATLLFVNEKNYRLFVKRCEQESKPYLKEAKGIVVLNNLLF